MKMNKNAMVLLAGVGAGVALGYWLSSEKGRKMRKKISTALNEATDEFRQKLLDEFTELKTKVGEIKDKGASLKDKITIAMKDLKEETKQKILDYIDSDHAKSENGKRESKQNVPLS